MASSCFIRVSCELFCKVSKQSDAARIEAARCELRDNACRNKSNLGAWGVMSQHKGEERHDGKGMKAAFWLVVHLVGGAVQRKHQSSAHDKLPDAHHSSLPTLEQVTRAGMYLQVFFVCLAPSLAIDGNPPQTQNEDRGIAISSSPSQIQLSHCQSTGLISQSTQPLIPISAMLLPLARGAAPQQAAKRSSTCVRASLSAEPHTPHTNCICFAILFAVLKSPMRAMHALTRPAQCAIMRALSPALDNKTPLPNAHGAGAGVLPQHVPRDGRCSTQCDHAASSAEQLACSR